MPEFVVARIGKKDDLTPTFNEASEKLMANKDLVIKDSFDIRDTAVFLIETTEKVLRQVKRDLPGWTVSPNRTI